MGRPKKIKEETTETSAPEAEEASESTIATHDMWMYHKTSPAKIFKQGEEIPDGWEDDPFMEAKK